MLNLRNIMDNQRGGLSRVLLFLLLAIFIVAGASAAVYLKQQNKVDELNQQISALKSRIGDGSKTTPGNQQTTTQTTTTYTSEKGVKIIVYSPSKNASVTSPVAVVGEVPGNWSFEASFPIKIKDADGNTVAQGAAQMLGDWMTEKHVPFSAQLTYTSAASGTGMLILQKDNPTGLTKNDDTLSIPIRL